MGWTLGWVTAEARWLKALIEYWIHNVGIRTYCPGCDDLVWWFHKRGHGFYCFYCR